MASRKRRNAAVWPTISRFLPYLWVYWRRLIFIFLLLLATTGFEILRPYLIGQVIDEGSAHRWPHIVGLLALFLVSVFGRSTVTLLRNFYTQQMGMRLTADMRITLFQHLQSLSLRFYDSSHTGKIVARISTDTSSIYLIVTGASANMVGDVVTILGVVVVLLLANWQLAIATYLVLPFFLLNYLWHKRKLRVESRSHRRNLDKLMSFLHERISSTRLVRAFATEDIEIESFRQRIEADFVSFNRVSWRNNLLSVVADFLTGVGFFAVLSFGSYLIMANKSLSVGELTSFLLYLGMLYTPITRIVDSNAVIQQAATALEKIFALLDTKPHIPENDQLPQLPRAKGQVTFEHVSFGYRVQHTTLHDLNFEAQPGQSIALVGPSGSGKTTIITLLARFYDATEGRILVDGQDIREFNVQSLRRQIGIVMQDNILFSGTIAENIRYGRPDATHEEMIEAARAANVHEFIDTLSNGYESMLGERGVQLSGGQRQRIAIARVVLKNPRILILDEATSALDTESERLVQDALERLMAKRTSIIIAHRLSTVINADKILVLKQGRIVEQGRHEELLAQGGVYHNLHNIQFLRKPEMISTEGLA